MRSPGALRQVVLVERLPYQGLNNRLAAYVQFLRSMIQLFQHTGRDIHIYALNGLNHAALTLEEAGNVLALISQPCNGIGRSGLAGFTSFLHTIEFPPWSISTA